MATSKGGGPGLSPEDRMPLWYIGHHDPSRSVLSANSLLRRAQDVGYDMLTAPITTPSFQTRVCSLTQSYLRGQSQASSVNVSPKPLISPLMPSDTTLTPEDGHGDLIAVTSAWIDLGSDDPVIADVSRQVLSLEITYAAFCGVANILLRGPVPNSNVIIYARTVREALGFGPYLQLHLHMPMFGELDEPDDEAQSDGAHLAELARLNPVEDTQMPEGEGDELDLYDTWDTWDTIRTLCDYHQRLSVDMRYKLRALEIPRQLPQHSLQSRWFSEPLRLLSFPRTSFLRNAKGYPVLSKQHQQLLTRYMRLRHPPWILLSSVDRLPMESEVDDHQTFSPSPTGSSTPSLEPTPAEAAARGKERPLDPIPHLRYMRHMQSMQPPRRAVEHFGQGYQDYLQSPLQPLTDNLESITYEVFEKDPVKYEWYERATALALRDLEANVGQRPVIVAVVGSGRGPLVTRALLASRQTGISVKVWAIEKNPNAHVLLQRRAAIDELWRGNVTVVKTDMRSWQGPVVDGQARKVDVMVSELLGSFADNELSPECLDGVQHVLHPEHGINIPQNYSAHLTPISTPRIYQDLLVRPGGSSHDKWEIPYVVMLQQLDFLALQTGAGQENLSAPDVREVWAFSHPVSPAILAQANARAGGSMETGGAGGAFGGDGSNEHNARSCSIRIKCANRGVCHGLAGYFETVLYESRDGDQKVELSTNPATMDEKSEDMISWFPIFFPLKTPLFVPDGAELCINMWRHTDDRKVWYEWIVEVYENTRGRRRRLGTSELHSSRRNGCLM